AVATPMNSDYAPVLDQYAVRARFLRAHASSLVAFQKELFPMVELLSGISGAPAGLPVTPSPNFAGSRRAAQAMALHDFLLGRSTGAMAGGWPPRRDGCWTPSPT